MEAYNDDQSTPTVGDGNRLFRSVTLAIHNSNDYCLINTDDEYANAGHV